VPYLCSIPIQAEHGLVPTRPLHPELAAGEFTGCISSHVIFNDGNSVNLKSEMLGVDTEVILTI